MPTYVMWLPYILDLMSSNRALSLSMSVFCWGQPTPRPSVSLGLGIWGEIRKTQKEMYRRGCLYHVEVDLRVR